MNIVSSGHWRVWTTSILVPKHRYQVWTGPNTVNAPGGYQIINGITFTMYGKFPKLWMFCCGTKTRAIGYFEDKFIRVPIHFGDFEKRRSMIFHLESLKLAVSRTVLGDRLGWEKGSLFISTIFLRFAKAIMRLFMHLRLGSLLLNILDFRVSFRFSNLARWNRLTNTKYDIISINIEIFSGYFLHNCKP